MKTNEVSGGADSLRLRLSLAEKPPDPSENAVLEGTHKHTLAV